MGSESLIGKPSENDGFICSVSHGSAGSELLYFMNKFTLSVKLKTPFITGGGYGEEGVAF